MDGGLKTKTGVESPLWADTRHSPTVQNSHTFRTKPCARPVNPPGCGKKYRRDTDVKPTRYRLGFSLLTKDLEPIRPWPHPRASMNRFSRASPSSISAVPRA